MGNIPQVIYLQNNQDSARFEEFIAMMNFNVKLVLCFMIFMSMIFSMEENLEGKFLTPKENYAAKMKHCGSEEEYQQALESWRRDNVTKFSWDEISENPKYEDVKQKVNMKNISDNIIYGIRKNTEDLFIFINPKTQ